MPNTVVPMGYQTIIHSDIGFGEPISLPKDYQIDVWIVNIEATHPLKPVTACVHWQSVGNQAYITPNCQIGPDWKIVV